MDGTNLRAKLSKFVIVGMTRCHVLFCTVECKTNQIFLRHLNAPKRCEEAERIHKWGRSISILKGGESVMKKEIFTVSLYLQQVLEQLGIQIEQFL